MAEHSTPDRLHGWDRAQLFVLLAWLCTVVFGWFTYERGLELMQNIVAPVLLAFAGVWVYRRGAALRLEEKLLVALTGWYVLTRMLNGNHYLETDAAFVVQMIAVNFVAFPFASQLTPRARQTALRVFVVGVVGVLGAIACIAVVAAVTRQPFTTPLSSQIIGINETYSKPDRLNILDMHPNVSAALFSIALGLSLHLCAAVRRKLWLIPIVAVMLGLYAAIGLTLSRTAMVVVALEIGGFAFLLLMKKLTLKPLWGKAGAAIAAGVLAAVLAFQGFGLALTGLNAIAAQVAASRAAAQPAVTQAATETPAKKPAPLVDQRHLRHEVASLSGRLSDIYPTVIPVLRQRPATLILGNATDQVIRQAERITGRALYHWHNSFLQALMTAGLPALLLTLAFSGLLVLKSARLALGARVPLGLQALVLPVAGVFVHGMLENLLFMNMALPNLLFMLLAGFLFALAREQAQAAAPQG